MSVTQLTPSSRLEKVEARCRAWTRVEAMRRLEGGRSWRSPRASSRMLAMAASSSPLNCSRWDRDVEVEAVGMAAALHLSRGRRRAFLDVSEMIRGMVKPRADSRTRLTERLGCEVLKRVVVY